MTRALASLVAMDFLLGLALTWDRYPLPGVNQPTGILVMALVIALGVTRRPTRRVAGLGSIALVYSFMVAWAIAVSALNGFPWQIRATKMMILLAFGATIAVGRIHAQSLITGYLVGALLNAGMFYVGLAPNSYPPYLTGFMTDKNVAGLVYAVLLILGLVLFTRRRGQLVHVAVFGVLLFLTGSRTSMAAAAVALLWVAVRNKLSVVPRLVLAGGIIWFLQFVEARFARIGVFANREGTDWFREQVDLATEAKLARSPWWGDGLGTAWVDVGTADFMFFHNSYSALRIEGGWVMVAIMLYLVAYKGMGVLSTAQVPRNLAIVEGGLLVLLVTASRLGEVFFTTPAFLLLGLAWGWRFGVEEASDTKPSLSEQRVDFPSQGFSKA